MKIGYARVSSNSQDLDLQKQALHKAGCKKVFSESVSGKDNNRSQLSAMLNELRDGDVVVVYKIDRIARSLKGLIEIIELLNSKNVDLVSLDSGDKVDTTSPMGKAFFQIAGVFAELERGMINARTKAGIEKAKADGVKFGRAPGSKDKTTTEKIDKIKIFLDAGKSYDWIAKELRVSKNTIAYTKNPRVSTAMTPINKKLQQDVAVIPAAKTIKLKLCLQIINNNKFVRGKKKTRESIEQFTLTYLEDYEHDGDDYILTIEYSNDQELEEIINELLSEMHSTADGCNCFLDHARLSTMDGKKYWE